MKPRPILAMLAVCLACTLAGAGTQASVHRSAAAKAAFRAAHPCPATGRPRGACPGWVVDHVEPLCAGGADAPSNMQWQSLAEARAKDRIERAQCARLRRTPQP